jgi:hypothetical protein
MAVRAGSKSNVRFLYFAGRLVVRFTNNVVVSMDFW